MIDINFFLISISVTIYTIRCLNRDGENLVHEYRDKTYIRKDILVLLAEYGELNQTKLLSYSGLNLAKHKKIIDELVERRLIEKTKIYGEVKLLYIIRLQKKEENLSSCVRSI